MPRGPLILAHRGDAHRTRENTLSAFTAAMRAGADGIEFDVRRADGPLVVHHDATLRLRGRRRNVSTLQADSIPSWMPRVEEVVAWARQYDATLDVELKEPGHEDVVLDAFRSLRKRCVFTSFHPDVVQQLRNLDDGLRLGWITKSDPVAVELVAAELRPDLVVLPARHCSARLVVALQQGGCQVWAWNVNSVRTADRLYRRGVSGLITDAPRRIGAWRDGLARRRTVRRTGRPEN